MYRIITDSKEIRSLVTKFKASLLKHFHRQGRRPFAFPGFGAGGEEPYYVANRSYGMLSLSIPDDGWGDRKPFLFNVNPRPNGTLSPDVEINFPNGLSRKTGACLVRETETKEILVCHRGKFNVFKGMIPFSIAHPFFGDVLLEVEDGDRITNVIPITQLGSSQTVYDVQQFVKRVLELKALYKENGGKIPQARRVPSDAEWWDNDEFEGTITRRSDARSKSYSYLHGTIRNRLRECLQGIIPKEMSLKRNRNVDLVILKGKQPISIFEIKTSGSFSSQLYKAIGQLLCYRSFYSQGNNSPKLFLVIPAEFYSHASLAPVFNALRICIILYSEGEFCLPMHRPLTSAFFV